MKLLIIRHAEPDYSIDSLTPKGHREAELLSRRLEKLDDVQAVYCSPLGRAKDTASYTLQKTGWPCDELDWLQEFHGSIIDPDTGRPHHCWDLMPRTWKARPAFHTMQWTNDALFRDSAVPQVWEETKEGLYALLARHGYVKDGPVFRCENSREGSILLFCHFALGSAIVSLLTDIPAPLLWQGTLMPPSSVTTLITEERNKGEAIFRCFGLGDTSHLYAAGEPVSRSGFFEETQP